jgi:hypothetical protein
MILGMDKVIGRLQRIHDGLPDEMANALREEAKIELKEAIRRTPRDTGALRRSGRVTEVKKGDRTCSVSIIFGGPTAPYAVYVHEDLEAYHPVGQAKFLESVLLESRPHMAKRLAARIKLQRLL